MAIFSGESEGNLSIWGDERVIAVIFLYQNFHKDQMSEGGGELQGRSQRGGINIVLAPYPTLFLELIRKTQWNQNRSTYWAAKFIWVSS